jgi:hypothetical protein
MGGQTGDMPRAFGAEVIDINRTAAARISNVFFTM